MYALYAFPLKLLKGHVTMTYARGYQTECLNFNIERVLTRGVLKKSDNYK